MRDLIASLSAELPVLIAGPTASGKSALALEIAAQQGGVIVNADALQVFSNWRVLTARPPPEEEAQASHALYGHVARDASYSVGEWLREVAPLLGGPRPIIVGGTGLYFTALTQGLAVIPEVAPEIRIRADALSREAMIAALDDETRGTIDLLNRMRVQRAWEVLEATGKGLARWQAETPDPLLALSAAQPLVVNANRDWLAERINRRFDLMVEAGALEEARANLPGWDPAFASSKAIGALPLIDHLHGNRDLKDAVDLSKTQTRQYAKRQRTWFRSKMEGWRAILLP